MGIWVVYTGAEKKTCVEMVLYSSIFSTFFEYISVTLLQAWCLFILLLFLKCCFAMWSFSCKTLVTLLWNIFTKLYSFHWSWKWRCSCVVYGVALSEDLTVKIGNSCVITLSCVLWQVTLSFMGHNFISCVMTVI